MADISPTQRRVLDAGLLTQKSLGRAVVLRELADAVGGAISTTHKHVKALVVLGVAKKSDRGPGFIFRRPVAETSARLLAVCKRHGLSDEVTGEILRAGGGW